MAAVVKFFANEKIKNNAYAGMLHSHYCPFVLI